MMVGEDYAWQNLLSRFGLSCTGADLQEQLYAPSISAGACNPTSVAFHNDCDSSVPGARRLCWCQHPDPCRKPVCWHALNQEPNVTIDDGWVFIERTFSPTIHLGSWSPLGVDNCFVDPGDCTVLVVGEGRLADGSVDRVVSCNPHDPNCPFWSKPCGWFQAGPFCSTDVGYCWANYANESLIRCPYPCIAG